MRGATCDVRECTSCARYECPRCAVKYCSVSCYSAHSERCVAAFARDARASLAGKRVSDAERARSHEALRKFVPPAALSHDAAHHRSERCHRGRCDERNSHAHSDSDSDSGADAEELADIMRLLALQAGASPPEFAQSQNDTARKVEEEQLEDDYLTDFLEALHDDLEGGLSFESAISRLPAHLASDFREQLASGALDALVRDEEYVPWWSVHPGIQHISSGDSQVRAQALPARPEASQLRVSVSVARSKGSPKLMLSVADLVCAYCAVARAKHGDLTDDPVESARAIWRMSGVLNEDARHECLAGALEKADAKDVALVFGGRRDWVVRALGEILEALRKGASRALGKGTKHKQLAEKAVRKVEFITAWCLGEEDDLRYVMVAREAEGIACRKQHVLDEAARRREWRRALQDESPVMKEVRSIIKEE